MSNPDPERVDLVDGRFMVAATLVAAAFDLTADQVRDLMRAGAITSRTERGEGTDAGLHRLTFFHDGRAYRLTIDDQGTILRRSRFDAGRRPSA